MFWRDLAAAVYTNQGSHLLAHIHLDPVPTLQERIIVYYQRANQLVSTSNRRFLLVYARYLFSTTQDGNYEMEVHRPLEMAQHAIHDEEWENVQFWSRLAIMVEEQSESHCYLGKTHAAGASFQLAVQEYLSALDLNHFIFSYTRPACIYDLVVAYYNMGAWSSGDIWLERYKQLGVWLDQYEAIGRKTPSSYSLQVLRELSALNLLGGRKGGVDTLLQYAVDNVPGNPWPYLIIAQVYLDHELPSEAVEVCAAAPPQLQRVQPLLGTCARAYYAVQDWEKAAATYRQLAVELPDSPWPFYWLAHISVHLEQTEAAVHYGRMALDVTPNNLSIVLNIGDLYERIEQHELALQVYRSALKIHPDHPRLQDSIQRLESEE